MDEISISARFAAYTWFTETLARKDASQETARQFADENWQHFLEHANRGLGRLLMRLSSQRMKASRNRVVGQSVA